MRAILADVDHVSDVDDGYPGRKRSASWSWRMGILVVEGERPGRGG